MTSFIPGGPGRPGRPVYTPIKPRSLGAPVETAATLKNSREIGRTTFGIYHGNIADADVGVIVNPTNRECNLVPLGATRALLETEGPTLRLFAQMGGPIEYKAVRTTGAKKLHAKYILHLAIDPRPEEDPAILTSLKDQEKIDIIKVCTLNVLAEAEKLSATLDKKGIALPPLGIEALGVGPEVSAKTMLGAIAEHSRTTAMEKIQLILERQNVYDKFNAEFNRFLARLSNARLIPTR